MTGFRIGYLAAHPDLISAMTRLQSHMCGNVCSFIQYGALVAGQHDDFNQKWSELREKRDLAHASVNRWAPMEKPGGAFYLFPDIRHLLKNGETDTDWAARLLEKTGVAVVPGEAFGAPGHIRISYAVAPSILNTGLDRMRDFI
jgi:aspartate aminotransferase